MAKDNLRLTTDGATDIVKRYLGEDVNLKTHRLMHGGMVHRVQELFVEGGRYQSVVAKVNHIDFYDELRHEYEVLKWYYDESPFPVPEPLAFIESSDNFEGVGVLMERIPALNLADARLSPRGLQALQVQLARHVAALHSSTRPKYGNVVDKKGFDKWTDVFAPMFEREMHNVRPQVSSQARDIIDNVWNNLDYWLPDCQQPSMVHGDLWATNILVDDSHPDRPEILAFIDLEACYCDPEYELAYLRLFRTVNEHFFPEYHKFHPIRPGYERRYRIYWLNTMMLHVRTFGRQYVANVEDVCNQIAQLARMD